MARVVTEKEKPFILKILSLLITLILLAVIAAGVMFFITIVGMSKKGLVLDNPEECAASLSTGATEHLSFSEDGHMTVTFDKNDIWNFFLKQNPDYKDKLTSLGHRFGVEYKACGFKLKEDGLEVDLEFYRGFIRIAFTILCDVQFDGTELSVSPHSLRVLSLDFPISSAIKILNGGKEYSWRYSPELTFVEKIDRFSLGDNSISFTGKLNTSFVQNARIEKAELVLMSFEYSSAGYLSSAKKNYSENPTVCFSSLLPKMVTAPQIYTELLTQAFAYSGNDVPDLENINYGIALRWFPDYSVDGYSSKNSDIQQNINSVSTCLSEIAAKLSAAYIENHFSIRKSELKYDDRTYNVKEFLDVSYTLYKQIIDIANTKICFYYDTAVKTALWPQFSDIYDKIGSVFGTGKDASSVFAPGMLIHGNDGERYVIVCDGGSAFRLVEIDSTVFDEMMGSEKPAAINIPALEAANRLGG